jgi:hypothetical protein
LLAEAETRRGLSSEVVTLTGGEAVIEAHRKVNQTLWRMEWFARGLVEDASRENWDRVRREYVNAINNFHECARRDLIVPGEYLPRDHEILLKS